MAKLISLLSFFLLSITLIAQERIDTDRPDQTESAFTVPKGWLQAELGFAKTHYNKDFYTLDFWTLPTLLSRFGISKKFELRLLIENERWGDQKRLFKDTVGLLPVEIGFKWNLIEEKGIIPRISVIAQTGLNRVSSGFSDNHNNGFLSPGFSFSLQNTLSDHAALGYNIGMEWNGDKFDSPVWFYTIAPGFDIGEKWYGYVEAFGFISSGEPSEHLLDAGVAYYINDNSKLDASAGFGISRTAPDYYLSLGYSFRFNTRKK
jgi:hypothetical protein